MCFLLAGLGNCVEGIEETLLLLRSDVDAVVEYPLGGLTRARIARDRA